MSEEEKSVRLMVRTLKIILGQHDVQGYFIWDGFFTSHSSAWVTANRV